MFHIKVEIGQKTIDGTVKRQVRQYWTKERLRLLGFIIVLMLGVLAILKGVTNDPVVIVILTWAIHLSQISSNLSYVPAKIAFLPKLKNLINPWKFSEKEKVMQTRNPELEDIKFEMEQDLKSVAGKKGDQIVASIRPILFANLDRGRLESFIMGDIHRVAEYISDVANYYIKLSPFIRKLQIEKTDEVWKPLSRKLELWAYSFFIRNKFYANIETQEIANECANTAAITILEAHFPYDTDFEPWAHVILLNTCRRFFQNETKKSIVPQRSIIQLDEALSAMDESVLVDQKRQEDKTDLLKAIAQLSDARRQVIEFHYLDGLSLVEIAQTMGKSVGAIHSLHFNALNDLRKILERNKDNT